MSSTKIRFFLYKWFFWLASRMCRASDSYPYLTNVNFLGCWCRRVFVWNSTRKTREGTITVANVGFTPPPSWHYKILCEGKTVSVVYICSLYLSDSVKLRVHLLSRWRGRIKIFLSTLQLKEREKLLDSPRHTRQPSVHRSVHWEKQ